MCQIQLKTGLGKSTIGRINKEVDLNKENNRGGRPSKLFLLRLRPIQALQP